MGSLQFLGIRNPWFLEVRAESRVAGVALVAPPNHPDGDTLVVDGNVAVCLVVLAELDQVVEGAAGLSALRLRQFDAEVVVVFVFLEADDIELQGV